MARPVLLDLFCGAGGAAVGYHRAGFRVIGIDNRAQPNYPFEFRRGNALLAPLAMADVIHASPPCQKYSLANNVHGRNHVDLVAATRERLVASGKPYIIENVPGAPLIDPVLICGRALGLGTKRHRLFESNVPIRGTACPKGHPGGWVTVFGHGILLRGSRVRRDPIPFKLGCQAMGIDWMTMAELAQAIPPAYTELLGQQVLNALRR